MKIPFVDLRAQYESIKEEIREAINEVIESSAFIGGSYLKQFETNFARFCEVDNCIGVGNGTDAIFIALKSLGIGQDDEVITAANSFIATSEAITLTGARVVFCDVDENTYNLDTDLIEDRITEKTRAIVPVHLYGQPVDMDKVMKIAKKHGLLVVEDCAQAHGARYRGKRVGTFGNIGCFSFYPGKNLGAYGDAGAIITNNKPLADKMRMFANHGRSEKYNHELEGINSRLDGMQAAILNIKLHHLEDWLKRRNDNARLYNSKLENTKEVITPIIPDEWDHVFHLYVVRVKKREEIMVYLKQNDISVGVHYPIALPNLEAYKYLGYKPEDFPIASKLQNEILSLPMFPELTEEKIEYITSKINLFSFG